MKLALTLKYDINLKDWDIDYIKRLKKFRIKY